MLVNVVDPKHGRVKEYFCDHSLLASYVGKQRALGKFLTKAMVTSLVNAVPPNPSTTYDKAGDREHYQYKKEPSRGDFFRISTLASGVEVEESDEEFTIEPPKDGRKFVCALLHDFVLKYGRKAKTGDVTTSQAYIVVDSFY